MRDTRSFPAYQRPFAGRYHAAPDKRAILDNALRSLAALGLGFALVLAAIHVGCV